MVVIEHPFLVNGWLEITKTEKVKEGVPTYVITDGGYIVDIVKSWQKITVRRHTGQQTKVNSYTIYNEITIRKPFFKDFSQSCFTSLVDDVGNAKWVVQGELSALKLPFQARGYILGKEQRVWCVPLFKDTEGSLFIPTPLGPIFLNKSIYERAERIPNNMTKRLSSLVNTLLNGPTDLKIEEDKVYRVTAEALFVRHTITGDIRRRIVTSQYLVDRLSKVITDEQEVLKELQDRHDKSMRLLP